MSFKTRLTRLATALAVTVATSASALSVRAGGPPQPAWNSAATQNYLDGRVAWWMDWDRTPKGQGTNCVSCHTAVPYALARPALAKLPGATVNPVAQTRLLASIRKRVTNWDKVVSVEVENND